MRKLHSDSICKHQLSQVRKIIKHLKKNVKESKWNILKEVLVIVKRVVQRGQEKWQVKFLI